jgi:hypothetical protein
MAWRFRQVGSRGEGIQLPLPASLADCHAPRRGLSIIAQSQKAPVQPPPPPRRREGRVDHGLLEGRQSLFGIEVTSRSGGLKRFSRRCSTAQEP